MKRKNFLRSLPFLAVGLTTATVAAPTVWDNLRQMLRDINARPHPAWAQPKTPAVLEYVRWNPNVRTWWAGEITPELKAEIESHRSILFDADMKRLVKACDDLPSLKDMGYDSA